MFFNIGDEVTKNSGYCFTGIVVSRFKTLAGEPRYVVECTVPGAGGMLHIYNEKQLTSTQLPTYTGP